MIPPYIALLLGISFIIFLFCNDKRNASVSNALWIPLMWLLIIGSRPLAQWLNPKPVVAVGTEAALMSGSPIDRAVFTILIIASIFILSSRKINWSQFLTGNAWIILLFCYCAVSILWSDFPFVSLKRWIKAVGTFLMVLVVLSDSNPVQAAMIIIRRCAFILVPLSIVFIKYYPSIGRYYSPWGFQMCRGVTTTKNVLGSLCLVFAFYFFWNLFRAYRQEKLVSDKKEVIISILFLIMISWLITKAYSAACVASLAVAVCFIMGISVKGEKVRFFGVNLLFVLFIFLVFQLSFDFIALSISKLGREMTFTGRIDLWKDVLSMTTNPLSGTGYESFWLGDRMIKLWENHWWKPNQAHNGYIEIYINLGLIGLFLLLGVIGSAYKRIRRTLGSDFNYGRFQVGFLAIVLIYNITEASFKGISIVWFVFLLIAVDASCFAQMKIQKNPTSYDFSGLDSQTLNK